MIMIMTEIWTSYYLGGVGLHKFVKTMGMTILQKKTSKLMKSIIVVYSGLIITMIKTLIFQLRVKIPSPLYFGKRRKAGAQ